MATNKRKDAAALFELLDNSTLKVPKNAGSLKIPDWWSSKTNGTPAMPEVDAGDDGGVEAFVPPTAPARRQAAAAPVAQIADDAEGHKHYRLFDPPPSTQTPEMSPSIRPPVSPAPARSAAEMPAPTLMPTPFAATAAEAPEESVAPRDPKIFSPQTYAQKRRPWVSPRPGAFARLPTWVLVTGLAAVVVLICGTVIAARHKDNAASASLTTPPTRVTASDTDILPVPAPATPVNPLISQIPPVKNTLKPVPAPPPNQPAQAYEPGIIPRTSDQYYVLIASTPDPRVAARNAKFIAENGVDVSTEIDKKGFYVLFSVRGFASTSAAKPLRDRIVEIGHLTPDFKKSGRAWDDAMIVTIKGI